MRGFIPINRPGESRERTAVGKLPLAGLFVVALGGQALGQDDVLKLKSGASFGGKIVAETERTVTIQFPGGTMELRREQIAEIQRGRAPKGSPEAPDPAPLLAGLTRFRDLDEWFFLYTVKIENLGEEAVATGSCSRRRPEGLRTSK